MDNWPDKQQEIWFQAGVTGEQQRIIKLLEDNIADNKKMISTIPPEAVDWFLQALILGREQALALIKGNK